MIMETRITRIITLSVKFNFCLLFKYIIVIIFCLNSQYAHLNNLVTINNLGDTKKPRTGEKTLV